MHSNGREQTPFRQFNSPIYEYECSQWQSKARNRTQQHTDSTKLSVTGWDRTYKALVSTLLSQRINPTMQARYKVKKMKSDRKES